MEVIVYQYIRWIFQSFLKGKWFPQLGYNVCTKLCQSGNSESHISYERHICLEKGPFTRPTSTWKNAQHH